MKIEANAYNFYFGIKSQVATLSYGAEEFTHSSARSMYLYAFFVSVLSKYVKDNTPVIQANPMQMCQSRHLCFGKKSWPGLTIN